MLSNIALVSRPSAVRHGFAKSVNVRTFSKSSLSLAGKPPGAGNFPPMVFEGRLLHPKSPSKVIIKPTTAAAPVAPVTPITPTPTKKSHFFRNFLLTTIGLTAIAYAGGVYYSLDDDSFRDIFTENVPFAESLVYFIEEQRFKRKFSSSLPSLDTNSSASGSGSNNELSSTAPSLTSSKTTSTVSRAGTPAAWTSADGASSSPAGAPKPKPKKTSPAITLPLIRVPAGTDEAVARSIESLNAFITTVNDSKASAKDIEKLTDEIYALGDTIEDIKASAKAEVEKTVAAVVDVAQNEQDLESTIAKIKAALREQEDKWAREYHLETQRLTKAHDDRLQGEIDAHSRVIFAHVQNQLTATHAVREKEFTKQIFDHVEAERDGCLSKLDNLESQLSEVQRLAVEAENVIEYSKWTAKLQSTLTRLRAALDSDEPVPLAPYFDALAKLTDTPITKTTNTNNSSDENSRLQPLEKDAQFLKAVLESVPKDVLTQGVLSPAQLVARFRLLEPELRAASLVPPNAGIMGHIGSLIFSKLLWKKSTGDDIQGTDVEAVLSRANSALEKGKVTEAVAEINSLRGWPKKLASDWLDEGRKRSEVVFLSDLLMENGKLYY